MSVRWLSRRIAAPGPYLTLCTNEQQFKRAIRHCRAPSDTPFLSGPSADATTTWLDNPRGELVCIVSLGSCAGRNSIEIAGLLVHEAVHIWQRYAERIGERHPGDEQEAYAIQSIAQELMAEYAHQIGEF